MKKVMHTLPWLLILSSVLVAAIGGYLKYGILKPLGFSPDSSVIELPFLMLEDEGLRFSLRYAAQKEAPPPETQPPESFPSETQPTQTAPVETTAPETVPSQTEPVVVEVEESWFDDALFIGDSRTVGLKRFGRLGKADYFCGIGMSYFDLFSFYAEDHGFQGCCLEYLLSTRTYGKIYICLGLNGCGNDHDMIDAAVREAIERIQKLQPDAVIILHGIIGVGPWKESRAWYFENENLYAINEVIQACADGESVFYIDANSFMTDADGHILSDYCDEDQCHLTSQGYAAWAEWILDTAGALGIP